MLPANPARRSRSSSLSPGFGPRLRSLALAAGVARAGAAWFALAALPAAAYAHGEEVMPPRLLGDGRAPWPSNAEAAPFEVLVPIVVHIRDDGTVSEVELERSVSPPIDEAALSTARGWRFEPARRGGRPIASKVRSLVRFPRPAVAGNALGAIASVPPARRGTSPSVTSPQGATAGAANGSTAGAANGSTGSAAGATNGANGAAPEATAGQPAGAVAPEAAPPNAVREVRVVGEAPVRSASEVTRDKRIIGAAPHRTGGDVLRIVPGMTVTQHSGEGKAQQIFYRGFDAVHGQDVEFWVAGAPVNDVSNVHGQGYADLHFVMPEVISMVRAQPGPYDARQGDFAVAGTVRMDLGYDEPGLTAKAQAGSFGSRRYFLAYHPSSMGAETFAAVETYATDGFGPSRAARRQSAIAQAVVPLGSDVTMRAMASAYATRFDSAGVVRLRDIETGAIDRFGAYDSDQGGHSTRAQAVLEFARSWEGGRWTFAPFAVARSLGLQSNFTGYLEDPTAGDRVAQTNDATTFGATGSYRRGLALTSPRDAIEAGIYARVDRIKQTQTRPDATDPVRAVDAAGAPRDVNATIDASDVAGYVDADLRPVKRVSLRGGLRLEGLAYVARDRRAGGSSAPRAAQGANLAKKATLDVAVVGGLHALASYGEGFRSPQARSLADGERAPFVRVRSAEVGARFRDGTGFEASLVGFYTGLSNDLVFDPATARNDTSPPTRRLGLAGEYVARPLPAFIASLAVTYTRSTFSESGLGFARGQLVPYAPQIVVRSDVAYTPTLGQLWGRRVDGRLGAGFSYFDARPLPYNEWGHGAFVVDARAAVRVGVAELGVDLYNAFDSTWYDSEFVYASNFSRGSAPSLVPGRHVTAGPPFSALATLAIYL
ncbi:MAG: TonB family protein [Polyangiaceae bacterium]|nr:TonB family protein [Polyangiaceae bacterium]